MEKLKSQPEGRFSNFLFGEKNVFLICKIAFQTKIICWQQLKLDLNNFQNELRKWVGRLNHDSKKCIIGELRTVES